MQLLRYKGAVMMRKRLIPVQLFVPLLRTRD